MSSKSGKFGIPLVGASGTPAFATVNQEVTVLMSTAPVTMSFGFIPPHGKTLTPNQIVTIDGDIWGQLRTGGRANQRKLNGLENAISKGYIQVYQNDRHVVWVSVLAASTINTGDLVSYSGGFAASAAAFTWGGSLSATQISFAAAFLGVALATKGVTTGNVINFPVDISADSTYFFACTSETHNVGDTLGPAKNPLSNALLPQTLVKSASANSIAKSVQEDQAATTVVAARFTSAFGV